MTKQKQKRKCNHFFVPTSIFDDGVYSKEFYESIKEPFLILKCAQCNKVVYSRGENFK